MWTFYRGLEAPDSVRRLVGDWIPAENLETSRDTIRQAREYFAAARSSPLLTRPVLAYYGMVSLAKLVLLFDRSAPIPMDSIESLERKGHGLKHHEDSSTNGFDLASGTLEITADGKPGALQPRGIFPNLATRVVGADSARWLGTRLPIMRLLRMIPQIEGSLQQSLGPDADYLGMGVDIHTHVDGTVSLDVDLDRPGLSSVDDVRNRAPYLTASGALLSEAAPTARTPAKAVLTFAKPALAYATAVREEFYSSSATLPPHHEGVRFDSILSSYALMYALSIIARYKPHRWAAILDGRGSSLLPVVEAFVATAERWWPNLLLNRLTGCWVRFAQPQYS